MEDNYPKTYKEVYELLKYLPNEEVSKIPQNIINTIENNMDKNYEYKVSEDPEFSLKTSLQETKAILAIFYRDYWATENEKEYIIEKQKEYVQKEEKRKQERYNVNKLFENKKIVGDNNAKELISLEERAWYIKFIDFIKKFLNKNKKIQ